MLYLIVGIAGDKYAIPACDIMEVAPNTPAASISGGPGGGAGLMEYRGRAIPLLDLSQLCHGVPCAVAPTTRTLIVKPGSGADLLGIRAERVTSTARIDDRAFEAIDASGPCCLAGAALSGGEIIRRIDLQRLLATRER